MADLAPWIALRGESWDERQAAQALALEAVG